MQFQVYLNRLTPGFQLALVRRLAASPASKRRDEKWLLLVLYVRRFFLGAAVASGALTR